MGSAVRDPVLSIGSLFAGSYEVLAPLGEGSFGRVYKGRQRSTGQAVAIKTLRLWQGDAARSDARRGSAPSSPTRTSFA